MCVQASPLDSQVVMVPATVPEGAAATDKLETPLQGGEVRVHAGSLSGLIHLCLPLSYAC